MKILIVNTTDIQGGAARAAYRLHKSLLDQDIDSQMLVQVKSGDDFTVIESIKKIEKIIKNLRPNIDSIPVRFYKDKSQTLFSPSWFGFSGIVNKINEINPDIVHLHWINRGMIKIEDIAKIKSPIVWSLHDMWAFTGGCHYNEGCTRYQNNCGKSKVLGSKKENDLSKKIFYRKRKTFSKIKNLTIIGLSRWINNCSKSSMLLKDRKHINLPNPIDTTLFKPLDKKIARELWSLPQDKKLVLFGAMGATSDPRKGFKELNKALNLMNNLNIEFVVFGSSKPKKPLQFKFKINYLGHLNDDISLVSLYSAVDVIIIPSLQENLSNVIMESLSCSNPVVAFDIGGNSDMVEHKSNGYLAKAFNANDLANGIDWILNNPRYNEFCINAREKVLKNFDSNIVSHKYIKLYQDIIDG